MFCQGCRVLDSYPPKCNSKKKKQNLKKHLRLIYYYYLWSLSLSTGNMCSYDAIGYNASACLLFMFSGIYCLFLLIYLLIVRPILLIVLCFVLYYGRILCLYSMYCVHGLFVVSNQNCLGLRSYKEIDLISSPHKVELES